MAASTPHKLAGHESAIMLRHFSAGESTREIADWLGEEHGIEVSHVAVSYCIKKYIADHEQPEAEVMRAAANADLDEIISTLMRDFRKADEAGRNVEKREITSTLMRDFRKADEAGRNVEKREIVKVLVKALERQARLNGLDRDVSINFNFDGPLPVHVDYRRDLDAVKPPDYDPPRIVEPSADVGE